MEGQSLLDRLILCFGEENSHEFYHCQYVL